MFLFVIRLRLLNSLPWIPYANPESSLPSVLIKVLKSSSHTRKETCYTGVRRDVEMRKVNGLFGSIFLRCIFNQKVMARPKVRMSAGGVLSFSFMRHLHSRSETMQVTQPPASLPYRVGTVGGLQWARVTMKI